MNKSEDERFCELAHKAIAKRAEALELAELETMLEDHPKLKQEFEELRVEVALVREALPLFKDIERQDVTVPAIPLERLRHEVRGVFEQRNAAKARLGSLLTELRELMTGGRGKGERERGVGLLAALEEILLTGGGAFELETQMLAEMSSVRFAPSRAKRSPLETSEERVGRGERMRVEADLQIRLRTMEDRLSDALRHLVNCSDEARMLLDTIREERAALERRIAGESEPHSGT